MTTVSSCSSSMTAATTGASSSSRESHHVINNEEEDTKMDNNTLTTTATTITGHEEEVDATRKAPKHKYAVLFGYIGTGYQGMQKNPGAVTIEDSLEEAMYKAGLIDPDNYGKLPKIDWSRAARTDKGVHAAGQCVSAKLRIPLEQEGKVIEEINAHLPEQIRVFDIRRVTKGFNAKNFCYERQYEYILPTFVLRKRRSEIPVNKPYTRALGDQPTELTPTDESTDEYVTGVAYQQGREHGWAATKSVGGGFSYLRDATVTDKQNGVTPLVTYVRENRSWVTCRPEDENDRPDQFQTGAAYQKGREDQWEKTKDYYQMLADDEKAERSEKFRLGRKQLETLRSLGEKYVGRLSFHNFTPRMTYGDASCYRIMREFEVSDPFLVDDVEYVRFRIRGQSFMLNQIRHMIGVLVDMARGSAPAWKLDLSLNSVLMKLPLAPATGLFLHHCDFTSYNNNRGAIHGGLHYDENTVAGQRLVKFKQNKIWKHIHEQVVKNKPFETFLEQLEEHPSKYHAYRSNIDPSDKNSTHVSKTAKEISAFRKKQGNGGGRRKRSRKN